MRTLIMLILGFLLSSSVVHADVLRDDTTRVALREFNGEKLKRYKTNARYDYTTKENWLRSAWRDFVDWFRRITGRDKADEVERAGGGDLFMILIIVAAVILLIFALTKVKFRNWVTGQGASIEQEYAVEQENIHEINFDNDILDAERAKDYRRAVRLLFLKVLKQLSDSEHIYWDP